MSADIQGYPSCCQAHIRTMIGNGLVALEDAAVLRLAPDLSPLQQRIGLVGTPDISLLDRHYCISGFQAPPAQYTDIMKVTPTTIFDLGWHRRNSKVAEALVAQRGQLAYAVSALCIWLMTATGEWLTQRLALHVIPLSEWPELVKPVMVKARQYGQLFGEGHSEWKHVFYLRKLIALCGRTQEEADWDKEMFERTRPTTEKGAYADGVISSEAYRKIRKQVLAKVACLAVRQMQRTGGSAEEHWQERWVRVPHGTTSLGGPLKAKLKELDTRLDWQMRATKPTVMEVLTRDDVLHWCSQTPRCEARGSTKPEPGLKRRALLAVDDCTAWIAGYASHRVETATKYGGMVLRQDPVDVAEWAAFDAGLPVWRVSNDYDNFNILHSLQSLAMVDLAFSAAWEECPEEWAKDKVAAHKWVAASYKRAFIRTPAGESRVMCGLWSGHRNTARDNTILHLVYLECVLSVMRQLFPNDAAVKRRLCGDDETVSYNSWEAAACHALVADALGFKSQVAKGLLSRSRDEFLQLMRHPGNLPTYPVAHTILTFCSGNWYKETVRALEGTVKDVSDHVWDICTGGLPVREGRELATYVIDYLMQANDGNDLVALEWWQYRGCGLPGGHPLWGIETEAMPAISIRKPRLTVPTNATNDGIQTEWKVWSVISKHTRERVTADRAWDAYKNVARHWLQKEKDKEYVKVYKKRKTWTKPHGVHIPVSVPCSRWRATGDRTVERSLRAAARACHFPPELLGTPQGMRAMIVLRPRDRARLVEVEAQRQKPTTSWRWYVPPLLRAS